MKAVILAADSGVRFDFLSKTTARSLLPIKGLPVIEHIINKVQFLEEVDGIYVITNSRFASKFRAWKDSYVCGTPITLIDNGTQTSKESRGAIRDLTLVLEKECITDDLLVIGGDNLFSFTLKDFLDYAKTKPERAVIGLYELNGRMRPKKYGVAHLDAAGKVTDFEEKPSGTSPNSLASTCVYLLPKQKVNSLGEYLSREMVRDSFGYYIKWLLTKDKVYGYEFKGDWFDVDDADSYSEAVFAF